MTADLTYRSCTALDDFHQCVKLQRTVWGFSDLEILPLRLFVVCHDIAGQNFGAFEPDGRLVGFVVALPGLRGSHAYFHSHMLGVLPAYRDRGVGRTLKLMQRDDAISRGVDLVEWTFDPLEIKNAFFNLERLGAVVRRYVPNRYGISTSALHAGLPTDRLIAEWWVASDRVKAIVEGRPLQQASACSISVPSDISEVKGAERSAALDIQSRLRREFQLAFDAGWVLTGFDRNGAYRLSKPPVAGLALPW